MVKELKDADISLVDLRVINGRIIPCCKNHSLMLKFTPDGIWRCVYPGKTENDCNAGCQEA